MLDFVLSKMTWLITSILVMSFIIGFYQIQTESIDDSMLQSTTEEVNRIINRLEGINGEMCVNFTFDRTESYRAIYLPGKIGGEIYKLTFYESYMRATSGDKDIPLHYGNNIQPLQMNGTETNVKLKVLLDNSENSYVTNLSVYSNQNFGIASRQVQMDGEMTYRVFVFLFTDTVYYSPDDDVGQRLQYGSSVPSISNVACTPSTQNIGQPVNITANVGGKNIKSAFYSLIDPNGHNSSVTMAKGQGSEYYHEVTCNILGKYSYKVWAYDAAGNRNITDGSDTFLIKDSSPPILFNPEINKDPQESGDTVIFYVDASDADGVSDVYINITPSVSIDGKIQHSMSPAGDRWTFSVKVVSPGTYSYEFSATDPSGNYGVSSTSDFIIEDTTPPVISLVSTSPNPGAMNNKVWFTATVTDVVDVSSVTLNISGIEHTMVNTDVDLWSIDVTFSSTGLITYHITAKDVDDNAADSPEHTIMINP